MSGLPLGAPVQRQKVFTPSTRVFDHIPRLREVLPNGGWPGAVYAQVLITNLKAAFEREQYPEHLDHLQGGKIYYTIVGPRGRVDVALVGSGTIIRRASPDGGNRLFFTDEEIGFRTGLPVRYPIQIRHPEEYDGSREIALAQGTNEGAQGAERVQARNAPQRKPKRTQGHVAQAGDRDRSVGVSEKEVARRKAASERMKAMHAARRQHAQ